MAATAYLRVYQPLDSFPPEDQEVWLAHSSEEEQSDSSDGRRWLVTASLPETISLGSPTEGAIVRRNGNEVLICPWRTRLRMLAGLLAFRNSVPDEIADVFVPESEALRAARELSDLTEGNPEVRSHILHANWHVPLRWFAAFDESERVLTEDKRGLRIRYESTLAAARERLQRAVAVLEASWVDEAIIATLQELLDWLESFDSDGLLELDYGSVSAMFSEEDLVEDRSAAEVGSCLDALEAGDVIRASRLFSSLTDKWTAVRGMEVVN
jgi:hypothetical protein